MKTKPFATLAVLSALTAVSAQAAVLNINDYTLVPDGTTYGAANANDPGVFEGQVTGVSTLNGGSVLPTVPSPQTSTVYVVTTFTFGASSLADIQLNFAASIGQDRVGVAITNNGLVHSYGDSNNFSGDFDLAPVGGTMGGQSVTVLMELIYDVNRSGSNDTLVNYWVNPTGSSTASGGVAGGDFNTVWNSAGFIRLEQRILNKNTPGTAGDSTITNTQIFTNNSANFGGTGTNDATWANALAAATVPEPSAALLGALGFLALLRRRR